MELIAAVFIIALLSVLAQRFGYDSQDGVRSAEYQLSLCGVFWDEPRTQARRSAPVDASAPPQNEIKHLAIVQSGTELAKAA